MKKFLNWLFPTAEFDPLPLLVEELRRADRSITEAYEDAVVDMKKLEATDIPAYMQARFHAMCPDNQQRLVAYYQRLNRRIAP